MKCLIPYYKTQCLQEDLKLLGDFYLFIYLGSLIQFQKRIPPTGVYPKPACVLSVFISSLAMLCYSVLPSLGPS